MVSTAVYAILSYDGSMLDCALNYAAIAVIHLSLVVYLHNLKVGSYKWIWIPLLGFLFLFQVMLFPHHMLPFLQLISFLGCTLFIRWLHWSVYCLERRDWLPLDNVSPQTCSRYQRQLFKWIQLQQCSMSWLVSSFEYFCVDAVDILCGSGRSSHNGGSRVCDFTGRSAWILLQLFSEKENCKSVYTKRGVISHWVKC
jgi:hypothetical protein